MKVATNPNSTAFVELAGLYRERGDLDRAMRLCLRGLQRHPTHVEAHFELGRIYEARGERELALDEWEMVQQLAPDHLSSRLASVELYLEEGRNVEAESELKEAERLAPDHSSVTALRKLVDTLPKEPESEPEPAEPGGVFDAIEADPGTLGVMLVDSDGGFIEGHAPGSENASEAAVGVNLISARAEAERVASYLELGDLKGMVVEGSGARLTISPVGRDVIIVATKSDLPAGQAARLAQRAWAAAEGYLSDMGR
jgi:tetratricopeptide (TPR) repeat protein